MTFSPTDLSGDLSGNIPGLIECLAARQDLSDEDLTCLLERLFDDNARDERKLLYKTAREVSLKTFGKKVYVRGLIEFTNYCRNNCYYCGIRAGNGKASRYRLGKEEILNCCREGYALGLRTFVLQGGEDMAYSAGDMAAIVASIKEAWPDCAVTLSIGEHSREDYLLWRRAGADRYLLRHETADSVHYGKLHPPNLSLKHRIQCLIV